MKRTKLRRETQASLEDASVQFVEKFNREMVPEDRFFFWQYCYSEDELKKTMIRALIEADIPEELIYIYDQTGLMVDEKAFKNLSKAEKILIEKAADIYADIQPSLKPLYNRADYDVDTVLNDSPLLQALYVLGSFIQP